MNLEEENKEKRKKIPLTREERLTFFFFPFTSDNSFLNSTELNKKEDERFEKFGFDLKKKQAIEARSQGTVFYVTIIFIIVIVLNW